MWYEDCVLRQSHPLQQRSQWRWQLQSTSNAFCSEFGVPCDCSPGTAAGQCSLTSHAFCCGVGTLVTYGETPVNNSIRMCWSRGGVYTAIVDENISVEESPAAMQGTSPLAQCKLRSEIAVERLGTPFVRETKSEDVTYEEYAY